MKRESGFTWKLGMFVVIGLVLFIFTIYLVGRQQNLFRSTFQLRSQFKTVSGLKAGNNVRFSGVNIGTVKAIELITDTTVLVVLVIQKEIQQFIKTDAMASIGSDGLMGEKVLTISPGAIAKETVKDNQLIASKNAIEMEDVMISVKTTVDNARIITAQLAQFSYKMNNGNGALSKLMTDSGFSNSLKSTLNNLQASTNEFSKFTVKMNSGKGALSKIMTDEKFGKSLDSTMANLQSGSKGLSENMEAAKHNFLLKGYFNKKKRAEAKKQAKLEKEAGLQKNEDIKTSDQKKDSALSPKVIISKDSTKQ